MAFFFEHVPTNAFGVADMMKELRTGFLNSMLDWEEGDPVERFGNIILVRFHPMWNYKINDYVTYGLVVGPGQNFKVTRLYPWNHPADNHARAIWKADQQDKLECAAEFKTEEHKYFDDKGRPVPPPPALVRTTNSYEWRRVPMDPELLNVRSASIKTDDWDHLYDSDDSMPVLESLNSGSAPSLERLDYSPLAPFSPRTASSSPMSYPEPLTL